MLLYTLQTSGQDWYLELIDLFTRRSQHDFLALLSGNVLKTMQESGHVGSLTFVEIVFVNYVNQGWVGIAQDLHRKAGCDEYGGKHFSFVLNLFGFPQENKVHSVALGLRRSIFVQFSIITLWSILSFPPQCSLVNVVVQQPCERGGVKSEEDPFVDASKPEACFPLLCGGGRRALPPPADGCQGDPGPYGLH